MVGHFRFHQDTDGQERGQTVFEIVSRLSTLTFLDLEGIRKNASYSGAYEGDICLPTFTNEVAYYGGVLLDSCDVLDNATLGTVVHGR